MTRDWTTPEGLAELERIEKAATAGPWVFDPKSTYPRVATAEGDDIFWEDEWGYKSHSPGDGPFVAAARTAIPQLLKALAERDAEIARLKSNMNSWDA